MNKLSKYYQYGGNPIYVSNPKDKRLQAYKDSLNLYKLDQSLLKSFNKNANVIYKGKNSNITQEQYDKLVTPISSEIIKKFDNLMNYKRLSNKKNISDKKIKALNYDEESNSIKSRDYYAYEKPKQPVIYKKPIENFDSPIINNQLLSTSEQYQNFLDSISQDVPNNISTNISDILPNKAIPEKQKPYYLKGKEEVSNPYYVNQISDNPYRQDGVWNPQDYQKYIIEQQKLKQDAKVDPFKYKLKQEGGLSYNPQTIIDKLKDVNPFYDKDFKKLQNLNLNFGEKHSLKDIDFANKRIKDNKEQIVFANKMISQLNPSLKEDLQDINEFKKIITDLSKKRIEDYLPKINPMFLDHKSKEAALMSSYILNGRPNIVPKLIGKRSSYDSKSNTINLDPQKLDIKNYLAELSHAKSFNILGNTEEKLKEEIFKNNPEALINRDHYDRTEYFRPGSEEYNAHQIIQPKYESEYFSKDLNNKVDSIMNVPAHKNYLNKLKNSKLKQQGGQSSQVIAEDKEYIKTNKGQILKIKNAPTHNDHVISTERGNKKVNGKGGILLNNIQSVLSATQDNRTRKDRLYTYKDEEIKIKPEDIKIFNKAFDFKIKSDKSISPAKLLDKLFAARNTKLGKFKNLSKEQRFSDARINSIRANRTILTQIPKDEDLYDAVFNYTENKKSPSIDDNTARLGGKIDRDDDTEHYESYAQTGSIVSGNKGMYYQPHFRTDQEQRDYIKKTIKPSGLLDIKNYWNYFTGTKNERPDDARSTELMDMYTNQNKPSKYIKLSKYAPTIGRNNTNKKYFKLDKAAEKDIYNSFINKLKPGETKSVNEYDVTSKYSDDVELNKYGYPEIGGSEISSRARALGNFNVSKSKDGKYLSYSDTFDVDAFGIPLEGITKGIPIPIYNRIYINKQTGGKLNKYLQLGGETYIIKKGDNLSTIAKKNNVSVEDIIRKNTINNPNLLNIGQNILIPLPTQKQELKGSYNIKKGDTLYDISKKYNIGINDIKRANNLKSDNIIAGSKLNIPFGLLEQVEKQNKKAVQTFQDNTEHNDMGVILNHHKNSDEEFVVINKKKNTLEKYKGNKLISSINVGLGKKTSDISTGLGGVKSYTTGAGVYTIADSKEYDFLKNDKHNQLLYGSNIMGYKNENGVIQGSFLHQVPNGNQERENKLKDNNPNNNRFSQGCVNCKKSDFENIVSQLKPGTKMYILPEEKGNFMEVRNNKVVFTTNKNNDIRGYNYTYDDKGNYLSSKVRRETYKPLDIKNKKYSLWDNRNTLLQSNILNKNKKQLMNDLNLDSDTYDVLAKQIMGHVHQETAANNTTSFVKDIFERGVNNLLDVTDITIPNVDIKGFKPFGKYSGKQYTAENSSRGDLQIRYNQIPKDILKKYNVNSPDDLDNLEKAIPIAMFLKKDGLQQVIAKRNKLPNLNRNNFLDFVPYQYNQAKLLQDKNTNPKKNKYVKNILNFVK